MIGSLALRLALLVLAGLIVLVGVGLLLAAAVVALSTILGTAGALALVGGALLLFALLIGLFVQARVRAERKRQRLYASAAGIVETALLLMPRTQLRRLEAALATGAGLVAILALLLHKDGEGEK